MKIVIDTSIMIDFIRTGRGDFVDLSSRARSESMELYLPTVVVLELWKGKSMNMVSTKRRVEKLFEFMAILPLSTSIAKNAGEIMRKETVNDFIDSVIAASALELDASLATLNHKHFAKVKGLKFFGLQFDYKF